MTDLFLAPHNDDEALFGAFTLLRYRPVVVVAFKSVKQLSQGVTAEEREAETAAAMAYLGCHWHQWEFPDVDPDWDALEAKLRETASDWGRVFAPANEPEGHEQHCRLGVLADHVFGVENVTHYLTYTLGRSRSWSNQEVKPEPEWVALKLQALACYRSQHRLWSTAHHFLADQREYYA